MRAERFCPSVVITLQIATVLFLGNPGSVYFHMVGIFQLPVRQRLESDSQHHKKMGCYLQFACI